MSQTTIASVTHPPETNGGIVTSYLPIFTNFPAIEQCSAEIYSDVLFVGFNPFYGQSILTSITCLPQAVTLWWQQTTPQTVTRLGPLVCPDLYTTASTSIVNSLTTFIACCPKSYTFNKLVPVSNVGECNSPLSMGQVVNFVTFVSNSWTPNSTTITSPGTSVSGVHINGYVFASTTTPPTSSTSPADTGTPGISTTSNQNPAATSPPTNNNSSTGGLTTGTKIGIGVGVPLAALGVFSLLLTIFLIRRTNKMRLLMSGAPIEHGEVKPELPITETYHRRPMAGRTSWEDTLTGPDTAYELGLAQHGNVHELSATHKVPFFGK